MALQTWYTHCMSANHGLQIEWTSSDATTLNIKATTYLQADLLMLSSVDADALYYFDLTQGAYQVTDNPLYYVSSSEGCTDTATCNFPTI